MSDSSNLSTERPTFVTHLECSMTGERFEPDRLHRLSTAGFPLLVRYDLTAVGRALDRDALSQRARDFWRYRELLPIRSTRNIVSLGELMTPLVALTHLHDGQVLVKDEGRLPTGSFKARGLAVAVSMSPSTRIIGGTPADRCRSDALFLTANASSCAMSTAIRAP